MEIYAPWVTRYGGMIVLPALIGVVIGAPLAARDFETGAYRFGLTQTRQGHGVRQQSLRFARVWIGYQPAARYWLFRAAAAVILITLTAAAGSWPSG